MYLSDFPRSLLLTLASISALLLPMAINGQDNQTPQLPVRRVVIYKNGVAYVERSGDVAGRKTVSLSFRAEEMTDILKSMSVVAEGGAVERVRFSTDESLESKLKAFPFHIHSGQSISALLDALRGSRIQATHGQETVSGIIIAARQEPAAGDTPARETVSILENGAISTYDVASLNKLRFEDPQLQQQLADYLRIVEETRNQERRWLNIDLANSAVRRLSACYMTPMPVWKSSYRIIFPQTGRPVLEGWALVDNTSGEDWNDVSLALVSGKPVSFLTNLYPPVNGTRPYVELPGISAVAPITYEGQMQEKAGDQAGPQARRGASGTSLLGAIRMGQPAPAPIAAEAAAPSAVANVATGVEAGALFSYEFPGRVNVRKGESVMLPFVQTAVSAERLMIFSERQPVKDHPMLALELDNDSGVTLDGGPVTVFDGGEYAGEALFDTTIKGEKRLLSYGVDLGTSLRLEPSSGTQQVHSIRIQRGVLTVNAKAQSKIKYTASNADNRTKTLLIERMVKPNYEVVSPKPATTTPTTNRFRVELPANGSTSVEIVEEYPHTQVMQIRNTSPEVLEVYSRDGNVSSAAREAIQRIVAKQREIARNSADVSDNEKRLETLNNSMERVRRNMESLNSISGQAAQVQRLAAELSTMQTSAANLEASIEQLRERGRVMQAELDQMIETIDI
jgi:hypothetical protein